MIFILTIKNSRTKSTVSFTGGLQNLYFRNPQIFLILFFLFRLLFNFCHLFFFPFLGQVRRFWSGLRQLGITHSIFNFSDEFIQDLAICDPSMKINTREFHLVENLGAKQCFAIVWNQFLSELTGPAENSSLDFPGHISSFIAQSFLIGSAQLPNLIGVFNHFLSVEG